MPAPVKVVADTIYYAGAADDQFDPVLTALPTGRLVLTQVDEFVGSTTDRDLQTTIISSGFTANTFLSAPATGVDEVVPGAAALLDGRFITVYARTSAGETDVYAVITDPNSGLSGVPFSVAATAGQTEGLPVVTALRNGNAMVIWQNATTGNVEGQIVSGFGTLVGSRFTVGTGAQSALNSNFRAQAIELSDGNIVVAWDSGALTSYRTIGNNGAPLSPQFSTSLGGESAALAELADGSWVVAAGDAASANIRVDIKLTPTSGFTVVLNTGYAAIDNNDVRVAALKDGRFVVIWQAGDTIAGQVIRADGSLDGGQFRVNSSTGAVVDSPTIAVMADGRFAVSWVQSPAGADNTRDVYTAVFDPREAGAEISGTSFDDQLYGTSFGDTMWGGAGVDDLTAGAGADLVYGGEGGDSLNGGDGSDTLIGGAGRDELQGDAGADQLTGGLGDDFYFVDNAGDIVTESGSQYFEIDTVRSSIDWTLGANLENLQLLTGANIGVGNALRNRIEAFGAGNRNLSGGGDSDTLIGGDGNDILQGDSGSDSMQGGLGNDSYAVDNDSDLVVELAGQGFDAIYSSGNLTLVANVEQLNLIGSATSGVGNALANAMYGNALANYLSGGDGADYMEGGGGDDILVGGTGGDILIGGQGSDSYEVDTSSDQIGENAGEGFDAVYTTGDYTLGANLEALYLQGAAVNGFGNSAANALYGNALANYLRGNEGDDYLEGGADNDILEGSAGNDIMVGGTGSDSYGVDSTGDQIGENANEGFDSVYATSSYTLGANLEGLYLTGSGAEGYGNSLANAIYGNGLDNNLNGFAGNDVLNGGAGNDTFVFNPGTGQDVISDFVAGGTDDRINLSAYAGTGITYTVAQQGANTVFTFSNGDAITLQNVTATSLVQSGDYWF